MSEVLALIAHDLKNALGGLEAQLGRLAEAPTTDGARAAHAHCQDLRQQFVQFLTLYGAEHGGLRALCEDESPASLLLSLQTAWQTRLESEDRPLAIEVEASDCPPFHYFDRRLVYMALDAAIHNASRFARRHIRLAARTSHHMGMDGLTFSVEDDGPGLDHHDMPDEGATPNTGLGTALCQAVARAHQLGGHHGHITLSTLGDAPRPDGTRFDLWLP